MKDSSKLRYGIINILIVFAISALMLRLIYLQVFKHNFYAIKSKKQVEKILKIPPTRGTVYDRHNRPLALTHLAYSVNANPSEVTNNMRTATILSEVLGIDKDKILKKLAKENQFAWIERKISEDNYLKLKEYDLIGIYFFKDEIRVYPNGILASDIIGFTGIDNQGLSGLEYKYDHILKGQEGKLIFHGDPRRNRLITSPVRVLTQPEDGQSIITTLDTTIQFFTEKYLCEGAEKARAESAQAIVMDPSTGDILAMADYPKFNANDWNNSSIKVRKNSCISDVFEPGSIFKVFTMAAAIEENLVTSRTVFVVPESITLYNKTIKEAHGRGPGESPRKTVSEILEHSLNVGTTMIATRMGKAQLYKHLHALGFGSLTGIELPGESRGLFRETKYWSGLDIATISFGQGIGITPIQMVTATSIIANGGHHIKPRIVQYTISKDGKTLKGVPQSSKGRLFKESTMKQVRQMMISTVDKGTGVSAQIKGFNVGGKTGTAQKAKENGIGYEHGKYIASFVGFFPDPNPKAVILVTVNAPQGVYYGSQVAAPIFRQIAEELVRHWNIDPTRPIVTPTASAQVD